MPQTKQEAPRLRETAAAILAGTAIAAGVCLLTLAAAAWLMSAGHLGPAWLERAPLAGVSLGALAGGGYAVRCAGRRALPVGLAVGAGLCLLWVLCGLRQSTQPSPALLLTALLSGALAGVLFSGGRKRKK